MLTHIIYNHSAMSGAIEARLEAAGIGRTELLCFFMVKKAYHVKAGWQIMKNSEKIVKK